MKFTNPLTTFAALFLSSGVCAGVIQPGQTQFTKGVWSVENDIVFADPVVMESGAVLEIPDGLSVTFLSTLDAGREQIFSGGGRVIGLTYIMPEWFGARGDGIANDTAPFQKALDSFTDVDHTSVAGKKANTLDLHGSYLLDSVEVNITNLNIHSRNAWLIANPEGQHHHLIRFTRQFCSVTGYLNIEGNYNMDYECMINVNTRYFRGDNITIWRAKLAWRFGNSEWAEKPSPLQVELGDSENTLSGCSTAWCIRGVEIIGSESIIVFNNSLIYSYPWTLPEGDPRKEAWEAEDATVVRCLGSYVYFTGCKLCNFTPSWPIIEVQPLKNTNRQYYSKYGGAFLFNTHIEGGNFFRAVNPKQIPTQSWKGVPVDQQSVSLSLISCGGYVSGAGVPINTDPLFTGTIIVQNCNFYTDILGGADYESTTFARIGNPAAPVKIDNLSLRNNYINGLGAIEGGMVLFEERVILDCRGSDQIIDEGGRQLICTTPTVTNDTPHFAACYDPENGTFTVPVGGLDNVRVTAGIAYEDNIADGISRISILKNGREVYSGAVIGCAGAVTATLPRLEAGDVITAVAFSVGGERVLAAGSDLNMLQIVASRY